MIDKPNIVKGSLWAICAFSCMAIFGILTKLALLQGSVIWINFIANFTGALILSVFIATQGLGYLKSKHYSYLLGRALFGGLANFLYTISIFYIPLVNGTLLFNTAPIFIPILSVFWLKATISRNIWFSVALGFIGIIVIIKPTETIFTQTGNLIALISGISLAIAYLLMKLLTDTDPGERIIFYYLGISALILAPLLFFEGNVPTVKSCFYAILSGIMLLAAQLSLVKGYKYAEASQIGIYQYTSVIFVGILDWMIWGILPDRWDIVGVVLVTFAGILIIRSGNSVLKKA